MADDFFDALLILGGSSLRQSDALIGLADAAANVYRQGAAPSIVTTGCCHHTLDIFPGRTEAQCLRDLLMARDVPSGNIFTEERSADLLGRAVFSQEDILIPCAWYHLLVLCPGAESQELRSTIAAAFTTDFSIDWLESSAPISEAHRSDLEDIRQMYSKASDGVAQSVRPRTVTASGAPKS